MDSVAVWIAISVAILLGAMSPGPSFVVVARTAVSHSRGRGILAALGMGVGGSVFAIAALLGLHALLIAIPSIHVALQLAGASYLLFLAYKLWRTAPNPLAVTDSENASGSTAKQDFLLSLGTQLSNPKTAIVYASIFSAALPRDASWNFSPLLVPTIFAIEFGWYALVAVAFSTSSAQSVYARWKRWIDRAAAGAMAALGLKVLADVRG
jgi:threonine/homoserine/homoserine lactone efflux protein